MMTQQNNQQHKVDKNTPILTPAGDAPSPGRLKQKVMSIRTKLTLLSLLLLAVLTISTSMVIIQIMDDVLYQSLVDRGASLAQSTATSAGYSILAKDHLALDNLAAKTKDSQKDLLYLAILDQKDGILAHNQMDARGSLFIRPSESPLEQTPDFSIYQTRREHQTAYEFQAPVMFADNQVGTVVVGIDSSTLLKEKNLARDRIAVLSLVVMLLGSLGTFFVSRMFTNPIARLAGGVSQITAGDYEVEVDVCSRDELGDLTRSFNQMSQVIRSQKQHLENYASDLEEAYIATVRILAAALDARDNYTLGHSGRVARLSLLIGERLGLSTEELKELEMACFLHDIGKIHVPDAILNKPTPLDQQEYNIIKKHPMQGAEILLLAVSLHKYIPVVLHHHEWYNGKGYPHGLKGDEIHLFAQIVAIADSYDAMTSSRPYRKGCTRDEALAEIIAFRGTQFSPEMVDIFMETLNDFEDDEALFASGGPYATHDYLAARNAAASDSSQRLRGTAEADRHHQPEAGHYKNTSNIH